ncbi:transcriptional regulator [Methylobacterium sp. J-030]|nr:transcriptional regulator [Methylobacterium sp. J-030]
MDWAYLGGLERQAEIPTVDLLDRVAGALSVPLGELFSAPGPDEAPPASLRGGQRKG